MTALTDSEFAQVRDLLGIDDDWDEYGRVGPAVQVRALKRNGRVWAAAPDGGAWVSRDERVMALIRDDLPAADVAPLVKWFDAAEPIVFGVDGVAARHVDVRGVWYSERLLAGLIALHGPPTHSAPSQHPGFPMLLWKARGHVRAGLMPVRRPSADRNLLAERHARWSS